MGKDNTSTRNFLLLSLFLYILILVVPFLAFEGAIWSSDSFSLFYILTYERNAINFLGFVFYSLFFTTIFQIINSENQSIVQIGSKITLFLNFILIIGLWFLKNAFEVFSGTELTFSGYFYLTYILYVLFYITFYYGVNPMNPSKRKYFSNPELEKQKNIEAAYLKTVENQ